MSDTVYSRPGQPFFADLSNAPVGLVGSLGVQIIDKDGGAVVLARTTAGISEVPAGAGIYVAALVAPEDRGDYLLVWDTEPATPATTSTDDLIITYDLPEAVESEVPWEPSVEEVARLVWARTKQAGGKRTGSFTDATSPTITEARSIIQMATAIVAADLGIAPCRDTLRAGARAQAALYASMLIETSYYPEQTESAGSSFQARLKLWEGQLKRLGEEVRTSCAGGEEGEAEGAPLPQGAFDDGLLLYGRDWPPEGGW